jgi:4-hydroxybenzoate polyprenyltransferase
MTDFLRLIRLPNLIIIALTLCGVRYGLMEPVWRHAIGDMLQQGYMVQGLTLHMSLNDFILLICSIVLIAAAGYIINDYFDTRIDRINKPEQVIVGRVIKRRVAMVLHLSLSSLGLLIGIYLSFKVGNWKLSFIHLFSIIALWFYSTHLKKQLLSGNLLISVLAALVPITAGLYEFASGSIINLNILNAYVEGMGNSLLRKGAFLVIGYSAFAFLSNLIREIVKDIEDMDGDQADGAQTLPLAVGETQAKFISISVVIFTIILLAFIQKQLWLNGFTSMFWYILFAVQIPFLVLIFQIWRALQKHDYTLASRVCKLVIVTGVLSMFVFRFTY